MLYDHSQSQAPRCSLSSTSYIYFTYTNCGAVMMTLPFVTDVLLIYAFFLILIASTFFQPYIFFPLLSASTYIDPFSTSQILSFSISHFLTHFISHLLFPPLTSTSSVPPSSPPPFSTPRHTRLSLSSLSLSS